MSDAQEIVAGAEYVNAITARQSDRRYRQAFQNLVLKLVPAGGTVFDFGSGPGIDARFYAERGRKVAAYDVDSRMCEYLAAYCHDCIAQGTVTLYTGGYREFLALPPPGAGATVDLVASNFAPLNLIDDLDELFARFAALIGPEGAVLASVLSPYFVGDLRYGWWWRNVAHLAREGRYAVQGSQARIWRRGLADFARVCAPYFALEEVYPGNATCVRADTRGGWLRVTGCRFMFLLWRRTPVPLPGRREPELSRAS